ncbi:STM4012 family radical SAM protein [Allorhodopirellula heiligendammensis]|uniref:Oxygen-independent coproporphyrinogen-III oxidase 1 n=1 Tax=Allorhodopirellula heiligendammensis TaxID=2714739 RepID=A0A5C6C2X7_9BACT|nr:STM4012 family radical SAM protein [Allorhodopirellula heiligendammensis]TWU17856.1 Oxygen-independent coproporphyrinogen-III oxidase 1 [Allorhodopirellula heiligendammensis]
MPTSSGKRERVSCGHRSQTLAAAIAEDQYAGYAYAYPHKTSYRELDPPVSLAEAWAAEDKSQLYLYLHLPFCEMRCGFCNLFTASQPADELVQQTLDAIARQSRIVAGAVQPQAIAQVAIGGGTPTYLNASELRRVFEIIRRDWPVDLGSVPFSVEVSPATVDADKLRLMVDFGVRRISMGVQSFVERDLSSLGRPQKNDQVDSAIDLIRRSGVEVFNLDLIYGNHDQTESDWLRTVQHALDYRPEEVFLYPLYVRELTGLGRTGRSPAENRRHLYGLGRDLLLQAGFRQISMRMFRRVDVDYSTQHCCQEDGMVGLGPGARSYTSALHSSSEYAVSGLGVRKIIANFNERSDEQFGRADYGVWLNEEEQSRRYLIRSLLQIDGLGRQAFIIQFGDDVRNLLPQVDELVEQGVAELTPDRLFLNEEGLTHSDVIGPWLYSHSVRQRMEQFHLR